MEKHKHGSVDRVLRYRDTCYQAIAIVKKIEYIKEKYVKL